MQNKGTVQLEDSDQSTRNLRREERLERRAARRADRQSGGLGWMVGLFLIAIGTLYLLQEFDLLPGLANWWALFMLLPAAGTLSAAIGAYRRNGGQWTGEVIGLLLGTLLFAAMTAIFLFGLDYGWFVPLFLIAAGMLLLARPMLSRDKLN
ncbi:MAG: LiaF transmembrane domain-containing protein [Candidatus Promineifilaceae bacterium]|jgi:hypothetical protein